MSDDEWLHIFTPGRVCLFGEHSDWAGGFRRFNDKLEKGQTIVVGTNQGLFANIRRHNHSLILSSTRENGEVVGPVEFPMNAEVLLREARAGHFWSYSCGVAYKIATDFRVNGLEIHNHKTTLPLKKGLSSSAAVCVLTARAFSRVYDLKLTVRGEMEYAYQGEILTPSKCGRMDQGCAFGSRPVIMSYDGDFVDAAPISVPKPIHLLVVDLCAHKDTVVILRELQAGFPTASTETHRGMQQLLGPINLDITRRAKIALERGDAAELGALMTEAMQLFDKHAIAACPSQLTAPVLHRVLTDPAIQSLVYGGKSIGAGGDGTAQFVCRGEAERDQLSEIITAMGMSPLPLTIEAMSPVRKAVITAAGFGQFLFPASKIMRPEMFPIMDCDGVVKPGLLITIEQILLTNIEQILLIVQEADLPFFDAFFKQDVAPENLHKLSPESQKLSKHILEIGKKVNFVIQNKQDGLGHAVLCARDHVGDEPFLLVLGDHLYRSSDNTSCIEQILKAFQNAQSVSIIGLQPSPLENVSDFGTATGTWRHIPPQQQPILAITEVFEKPTPDYAQRVLRVPPLPEASWGAAEEYMTIFGVYVLDSRIFGILEDDINANRRVNGVFGLTPALERLRHERGLLGLPVHGTRYDFGTSAHLMSTIQNYHLRDKTAKK